MHHGLEWKRLLVGVALVAPIGAASAQDAARWPEPLKGRNSRYANLERVADEAGDRSEQVLRDLKLVRTLDAAGDREELRKDLVSRKQPPRARLDARIARTSDARDDEEQVFLARLPRKERRHAELRRFRDFAGDQVELARYRDDKIRYGNLDDRIGFAEEKPDGGAEKYLDERGDEIRRDRQPNTGDQDRRDERDRSRREEFELVDERFESKATRDVERDEGRDEDRLDDLAEKDDERDADKRAEKADRDLERKIDADDLKSDRDTERQIQQEDEANAPGDD